jgi:hypothetical protein
MPESVTDRPTKAHEYVFLLSKAERYYYDADAIAEPVTCPDPRMVDGFVPKSVNGKYAGDPQSQAFRVSKTRDENRAAGFPDGGSTTRNARTVWTIPTSRFPGAHFATFPKELARRCILAGSAPGDTVLDPFGGSGTVGAVAVQWQRNAVLIDLNADYCEMARRRIAEAQAQGLRKMQCGAESAERLAPIAPRSYSPDACAWDSRVGPGRIR